MEARMTTRLCSLALALAIAAAASGFGATGAAAIDAFSPCVRAKAWAQNPNDFNVRTAGVSASSRLANAIRLREACQNPAPGPRYRHHWG
jgi:hypothetical protein